MCTSDISIYPNPAEVSIVVKSPSVIGNLSIISTDGREVKSLFIDDTIAEIVVEDLSAGIYVVKANGITKMMIKK